MNSTKSPQPTKLHHLILRVPKDQAAFLYFQLEANEGLCFYSTLDQSLKEAFRDIEIFYPDQLNKEVDHLFSSLEQLVDMTPVLREVLDDGPQVMEIYSKAGKKSLGS